MACHPGAIWKTRLRRPTLGWLQVWPVKAWIKVRRCLYGVSALGRQALPCGRRGTVPGCASFQGKQRRGACRLSFTPHNGKGVPPRDGEGDIQKLPASHSQYVGEETEGSWKVGVRVVGTTTGMVHELQSDRVQLVLCLSS